jgi:hypothetical protein
LRLAWERDCCPAWMCDRKRNGSDCTGGYAPKSSLLCPISDASDAKKSLKRF